MEDPAIQHRPATLMRALNAAWLSFWYAVGKVDLDRFHCDRQTLAAVLLLWVASSSAYDVIHGTPWILAAVLSTTEAVLWNGAAMLLLWRKQRWRIPLALLVLGGASAMLWILQIISYSLLSYFGEAWKLGMMLITFLYLSGIGRLFWEMTKKEEYESPLPYMGAVALFGLFDSMVLHFIRQVFSA